MIKMGRFICHKCVKTGFWKTIQRPSQGFSGTGEKGHMFQDNRGTKAKFLGEQGYKDNIGGKGNIRK